MIKAIIFDCFGVLVQGTLENFIDQYLSHDEALVARAHDINNQCSLGFISYDEQIKEFSLMAKLSIADTHKLMDNNPRNTALLSFIRDELKGRYKIGFLSNAGENWMDELFTAEDRELFDDVVLSYEYNLVKPDAKIYELAAERLGVEPSECVFIDDIYAYVTGARDVGMQALQYKNFAALKSELAKLVGTK